MTWWAKPDVKPVTATPSATDQAKPANAEQ
ncbi:ABC transporter, periplasmic substrate-binding protein [Pseudomonas syringae pv. maculicola]|nr:ABC transporter, periplasmic substrate-binding protein [Pseudomonas syringae pv. maculicola]